MDREQPTLDWQRLNQGTVGWRLSAFAITNRDGLWLVVVVGLIAAWGVDRCWVLKHHDIDPAAQGREMALTEELRSARELQEALAVRHREDEKMNAKLRRDISALQVEAAQSGLVTHESIGRER
jgi:hypothetical protein